MCCYFQSSANTFSGARGGGGGGRTHVILLARRGLTSWGSGRQTDLYTLVIVGS